MMIYLLLLLPILCVLIFRARRKHKRVVECLRAGLCPQCGSDRLEDARVLVGLSTFKWAPAKECKACRWEQAIPREILDERVNQALAAHKRAELQELLDEVLTTP